jgi:exo-1,4-beta-D-glucosaminidase
VTDVRLTRAVGILAALALVAVTSAASAEYPRPATDADERVATVPSTGHASGVPRFLIHTSAGLADTGAAISRPGYVTTGWTAVPARSTVYGGLVDAGAYPDPMFSTNMAQVPVERFAVPWWYRADVMLDRRSDLRTHLDLSGVLSRADLWVNGVQVATAEEIAGMYTRHEFDITSLLHHGRNGVALKVFPNDAHRDLTTGWIDWAQPPPDRNMGLSRDVVVRRSGPVALRDVQVLTQVDLPSLRRAEVTVKADVRNDTAATVRATVTGEVAGEALEQEVTLAPGERRRMAFPAVTLANPKIWWPAGMGEQPLYDVDLTASVGGAVSDTAHDRFGVREVKAPLEDGERRYYVNGKPVLIRGAGWTPDLFLRWDATRVEDKIRYVRDLGLNALRLEGHLEPDEFFDLTDRYGVLVLPGWECCNKWENDEHFTPADLAVAGASMAAEARRLRNHPSVISFLIGSDFAPTPPVEKVYVDALTAAEWPTPVVPAADEEGTAPLTGPPGVKMTGPYEWVPPEYWYVKEHGAAFGFNTETSAGISIPTMDTLRRMLTPAELDTVWEQPDLPQYHLSPSDVFNRLTVFNEAIEHRLGPPTSLEDYVRKAQLIQYEATRAQFEAFGRNFSDTEQPANGVIYWMLYNGWTSLHWQLFDHYLDQNGAYFGAKKANEPVHVQYSYDDRSVVVVNFTPDRVANLTVTASLHDPDGTEHFRQSATVDADGGGARATAFELPQPDDLADTYLVKLVLTGPDGREVSRNVYWLSTTADVIDYEAHEWFYTPTSEYADLTGLSAMQPAQVAASARHTTSGDTTTTTVTLRNTSAGTTPALQVDAHIVTADGARPVLPVHWTDNQVSLWPGEEVTLTATYRTADLGGAAAAVRVGGWNVEEHTVST